MKKHILKLILLAAKLSGLFGLCRRITSRDLRILCYHGASIYDEHLFNPGTFMTEDTFARRMSLLANKRYPVIGLQQAVDCLQDGGLPPGATVITIDDGWYGTYAIMAPILHRHGMPATLYIASYYLEKQTQVFNVAARYVLWRSQDKVLDLSRVTEELIGVFTLADDTGRQKAHRALDDFADSLPDSGARQSLFRNLCSELEIDWQEIEANRRFGYMSATEAKEILDMDVDIQLHTHRHSFRLDSLEQVEIEIEDNRRALSAVCPEHRSHFCYPSGYYREEQIPWLERVGIESATTTKAGFNRTGTSPYELRRFLDSETISDLEFEAEMSGFFELIRRCGYSI